MTAVAGVTARPDADVRYSADAVVPCDGSGPVLRPGVVEVSGGVITHVGRTGSPAEGARSGRYGSAARSFRAGQHPLPFADDLVPRIG